MLTAGIDVGAKTVKLVLAADGQVKGKIILPAGQDAAAAVAGAWDGLDAAPGQMERIIATGLGKASVKEASGFVSEIAAAARGARALYPEALCVVEVGAEEGRAVRISPEGKVTDSIINEKCAAGAGAFAESMARALEVSLEEFGRLSLESSGKVAMNAQCAVFAESELVALLHNNTPKQDMAKAVLEAMSERITSMVRRIGLAEPLVLIGGLARNVGFVQCLNAGLKTQVMVPDQPEIVGAFGAALLGAEGGFAQNLEDLDQ